MLGFFRSLAGTWPARIFFGLLAVAFVGWGIAGRSNFGGGADPSSIATVGDTRITAAQFENGYRHEMQRISQEVPDPSQLPPDVRRQVGNEVLQTLITQKALVSEANRMGLSVPESAVQAEITAVPAFQGLNGKFDHNQYLQVLQQNNLTPARFQEETREDLTKNQLLQTVAAGGQPPKLLASILYTYLNESRTADMVTIPFAGRTPPAAPTDAVLQRYVANNISRYTAPEYRRIKMVVLSPGTIGRTLAMTDADLHTWWEAHKEEFQSPEKRSMEVITTDTDATARALAALWRGGASWDAMQAAAKKAGATASTLTDSTAQAIPAPELAKAAFAAPLNQVTGPIAEPLGVQLVMVTGMTAAKNPTYQSMIDTIRTRLGEERGADLIDERAQKLEEMFAGGTRIDEVPADMGAAGAEGTLDAAGNTPEGKPGPIPAPQDARVKLIDDAFHAQKGDTTQLTEGPGHVWYAVQVLDVTKAAPKPFASIRMQALSDWQAAQIRHSAEEDAAKLLTTVKGGETLAAAAWGSGRQVTRTPPVPRGRAPAGVPAQLAQVLPNLKKGDPTMVETPTGFVVAVLADIHRPDAAADESGVAQVRQKLASLTRDVMLDAYARAVATNAHAVPNTKLFDQMTGEQ